MTRRSKRWALLGAAVVASAAGATYFHSNEVVRAAEAGDDIEGLRFRLSAGKLPGGEQPAERTPLAAIEKLSDLDADKILARVKAVGTLPDDEKDFALREASLPAPRAGQTVTAEFPPKPTIATAPVVESGALALRRFQPEGEVPLADRISLTFSQPMVAVTGQEDAAARVPVTLSPNVAGKWRWLGTQTLIFDAGSGKRLPMATEFTVSLPSGTKSVTGGVLDKTESFSFKTPAVRLLGYGPQGEGQRRDPLIWLSFDQKIDPDAVLKTLKVSASGKPVRVQRVSQTELEKALGKSDTPERWLAVKPTALLPGDSDIAVQVGPGTPSAEGPRVTEAPQSFSFRTYGPLKLIQQYPGRGESTPPSNGWTLQFSNPLDAEAFDPAWVSVSPATPGLQITANGNYIQLYGSKKARTTYKVTVSPKLKDTYGQTLEGMEPAIFTVGAAEQQLAGPQQPLLIPDPSAPPRAVFASVNIPSVKVKLYQVSSADWDAWRTWQSNWEERRKGATPPGKLIKEQDLALKGPDDELHENDIALPTSGNTLVWWEAQGWKKRNDYDEPPRGAAWVQSTKIGLSAFADGDDLYALATELTTGKPISGAQIGLVGSGQSAKTGKDGLVKLALNDKIGTMLTAKRGGDSAFLPARFWRWDESGWRKTGRGTQPLWFIFDDRQLYKPGEKVHVKGWLRTLPGTKLALQAVPKSGPLSWQLRDSRGNEISKGETKLNAWGGFDVAFELPKTMNLGQATLLFSGAEGAANHGFNVQEFRRPEFEVTAKSESAGPHIVADPKGTDLSTKAAYYAGGPLPGAQTTWTVSASPTSYTPPGRSEFTFGKWTPWWSYGGFEEGMSARQGRGGRPVRQANLSQSFTGQTDPTGTHRLHLDFDGVKPAQPYSVSAQAAIQDVNRQTWAASTSLLVHPSARYVGLKSKTTFVSAGKPLVIAALVCDIDGKPEAGQEIQLRAGRQEWEWSKGRYRLIEKDIKEWTVRSGKEAISTEIASPTGGQWKVRATVRDSKERLNESELTLWVSGGKPSPRRDLAQEPVTLIPSAKEFTPGQTAEILVQAPFYPAEGVLTLRRDGVIKTERFTMSAATQTLKIPIQENYLPNIHAHVELVGAAARTDDDGKALTKLAKRPAFASGELDLAISLASKKLTVVAKPTVAALAPGGETEVAVSVKDATGKPIVGGEVALVVVDESVLALAGWSLGDPVAALHPHHNSDTNDWHLRSYVKLEDPLLVKRRDTGIESDKDGMPGGFGDGGRASGRAGGMARDNLAVMDAAASVNGPGAPMRMMKGAKAEFAKNKADQEEKPGGAETPITVRSNFDPLAQFSPSVTTDSDGIAHVRVKLPDNLTRYRIVAVAAAGADKAGSGESALTARLPLMARPSAPRFLNIGDKFELPVVLQNQTDSPMTVDVAVRATNATLTEGRGRRVKIPANDRVEVRFPTESAKPGTARFQFAAITGSPNLGGGGGADSAEVSLPVWTPATTEAFATYGVIDKGAIVQPVRAPSDANPTFGELEVTTSSTALQELTDAYIYLASYPYGCAEQISSRVLTTAALKDVLSAFKAAGMPKESEMNAAMARDLARLGELQNPDGGYGFWARNERPWPYLGVHVAHALVRAKQKDFAVPDETYKRSLGYLKAIETKFDDAALYSPRCRRMIIAYALYVRHLAGDSDKVRAKSLLNEAPLDELGPETIGWLLNILAGDPSLTDVRRWLDNKATETAGAAHYTFSYSDGAYLVLHSDRRADGVILDALIADQPQSDLIPKLVRGLLDGRKRGAWGNTQENAFILLALDRYFRKFEGVTPDFVARLWLGEKFAGEGTFKGRTTDRVATKIPMRYFTEKPGMQPLTIDKQGAGRLYYRIGMRYAPKNLQLPPADYGFSVSRTYEAIDNPADVKRDTDGTWVVKAGAKVRVKITMVATTRRYHVALTDPMPAGFEALNPELRGMELAANTASPQIAGGFGRFPYYWSWWHWYEHQNLRDERAEAFSSYLWEGAYEYSYICRATTPGSFIAPPAKAEEMYAPETFGRSASDRVRVE